MNLCKFNIDKMRMMTIDKTGVGCTVCSDNPIRLLPIEGDDFYSD